MVGVSSDGCILCTAIDAFYRGYSVIVVEGCVESFTEEGLKTALHEAGFEYVSDMDGFKIFRKRK